mmetsp:Transcript_47577/g.110942  ORF Transcript_47577/g.110942 Transcript_47577/m.110942 type:complete len:231 (-) Transcript_47577:1487-2179(-)
MSDKSATNGYSVEGAGKSFSHLTASPNSPGCTITWFAPVSRNSCGLSAVSNRIGIAAAAASTTAGSKFATALPEVTIMAVGAPAAFAHPSAWKQAPRSSWCTMDLVYGCLLTATTNGVEREPGQMTKFLMPNRTSSITMVLHHRVLMFGLFTSCSIRLCVPICSQLMGGKADVNDFTFMLISSNSPCAVEPGTTPAPPYTFSSLESSIKADRSATIISAPSACRIPQGPA